jgi:aldehyde dehydrogenase (NAD+)
MNSPDHRAEIHRLFDAQVANRWAMAGSSAAARIERLTRLRAAMRERRLELLEAIHGDFGKQAVEAEMTELFPVIEELTLAIHQLERWMRPRRVGTPLLLLGSRSQVRPEAKGVVLVLAPWNYPFVLALSPVVAALAAGNTVMLRPSERTPRTARFIRDLLGRVFPENEVAVLLGDRALADALLELPFDHILFTGSASVGRKVMAAAARHLTPVTLELGGKSPAFVDETADIDSAAERLTWAKFVNAGQTCLAPDYVLVHEAVAPRLEAALKAAVERFYGADEETRLRSGDLASLVDAASAARLDRAVQETVAQGARVVVGGRVDAAARRMAPTVLADVPDQSAIMAEEIFGPVLPLLTYRDLDEAIRRVRGRPKPLGLYVFSRSERRVEQVLGGTSAGGTCVNNALLHFANPHLPFGGVGESGMGSYHGRWGFDALSHHRAILRQTFWASTKLLFPPYTARVAGLVSLLRRLSG